APGTSASPPASTSATRVLPRRGLRCRGPEVPVALNGRSVMGAWNEHTPSRQQATVADCHGFTTTKTYMSFSGPSGATSRHRGRNRIRARRHSEAEFSHDAPSGAADGRLGRTVATDRARG